MSAASVLEQNAALQDHKLKQKRMVAEYTITADATPADKQHSVDVSGVMVLRTEGKTTEADAIEDLSGSFTTAADNSAGDSVHGVLMTEMGSIRKVYSITVTEQTSLASSFTVTTLGTNGLTSGGNVAFEIDGTGLNLASESPTFLVEVDYLAAE